MAQTTSSLEPHSPTLVIAMFALSSKITAPRALTATKPAKSQRRGLVVKAGKTIDTSNRREMMKKNQEAARKKAEDAKAKSKALAEKSKAAAAKAAEAKKAAAAKAEAKRKEMAKKTAALNKTVGGTSRFAKSMSKGPVKMKDPLEGKKFNPFSLFGKKD